MHIERLKPSHAAEYRQMMLEAYELCPDAFTSSVAERAELPLSWWEARLGDDPLPLEIVLGAFTDDRLAGVAGLSFEIREKVRHKATLFGMYVPGPFRQRGVGKLLMQSALEYAQTRPGVKLVKLTVTQGNHAAQSLYEKYGFESFGLEPYAISVGSGYAAKVHMWCDIGVASDPAATQSKIARK
ncbi:MAG: GNAT family N-acetyltransferase [Proteobacteria bacterium]|nr:GNAT family N-acetyltransferase [Pseudomonadota bacterium]